MDSSFSRIFWWGFLLTTSPVGFAFEAFNRLFQNQELRSRKNKLVRAQKSVQTAEKSRKESVEKVIERAHVGLAVEVPANEQPSVDAYERAYDRINPPEAMVGAPRTQRRRSAERPPPDEDDRGL